MRWVKGLKVFKGSKFAGGMLVLSLAIGLGAYAWAACPFDPELCQVPIVASSVITDPDGYPNVLLVLDISGSMNNIDWVDGFDPRGTPDPADPGSFIAHPGYQYYNFNTGSWDGPVNRSDPEANWANMNKGSDMFAYVVSSSTGYIYARRVGDTESRRLKLPLPSGLSYRNSSGNGVRYDERYLGYLFAKYAYSGDYAHQPDPTYSEPYYSPYWTVWSRNISSEVPNTYRMYTAKEVVKQIINAHGSRLRFALMPFNYSQGGYIRANFGSSIATLTSSVNGLTASTWTPLGESVYESYRVFAGLASKYNSGVSYTEPMKYYCQKNFMIVVTDGDATYDTNYPSGLKATIDSYCENDDFCKALRSEWGYGGAGFPWYDVPTSDNNATGKTMMDGMGYYLNRCVEYDSSWPEKGPGAAQKASPVKTYTVGFAIDHPLLDRTAKMGDGIYYKANSVEDLTEALTSAIADILDRSYSVSGLAFSSPTYRAGDTYVVTTRFRSGDWYGDIIRENIEIAWDSYGDVVSYGFSNPILASNNLPGWQERVIYTDDSGSIALATAGNLGFENLPGHESDTDYGPALVEYLRGDSSNEVAGYGFRHREGGLADIVHSAPAVDLANDMIYVGGNGGALHAIELSTMRERWMYIPSLIKSRLIDDLPVGAYVAAPSFEENHKYTVDLSANLKEFEVGGSTRIFVVGGLRGGGVGYFCLDVTNPYSPSFKWKIDASAGASLGYSFSEAQVYYYQPPGTDSDDAKIPVMFTGNGYGCIGGNSVSDRLLMVDLDSGTILANVPTGETHGGLSTPVIYARRNAARAVYAGDLGGNVWRFKPPSSGGGNWTVNKLWAFGSPVTAQLNVSMCQNVPVVLGGTGKYLQTDDVNQTYDNYIFAIRDLDGTGEGWWKITLSGGERVVSTPEVVWGESWFVTMTPAGDVCSQGGSSRMFRVAICPSVDEDSYSGGDGTWQFLEGDLMQPPVADPDDPNPDSRPQMEAYSLPWLVLSNPRTIEDEEGHTAIVVQGSITGDDESGGVGSQSFDVKSGKSRPMSLRSWQTLRWMQNLDQ
ncbi:MAG: hypothetical protein HY788_24165 [Deltaproteobacteria bacterium]|nr:hypothetical protein [Deltaproteobacteria bacterium]